MKKIILTGMVIVALAGAGVQTAHAGDREWATVGKVLTGVAAVGLIAAVVDSHAQGSVTYSYGAPAYCPPSPQVVYCAPPPVVYNCSPVVYCQPAAVYYAPAVYRGYGYGCYRRHDRW
jgi:hypothetical protein